MSATRKDLAATAATAPVEVVEAETHLSTGRRVLMSPSFALGIAILVFVLFGATQSEQFLNPGAWTNILRDATFIAIPAAFACLVLISGGLDLSVGSVLVGGAMVAAAMSSAGIPAPIAFLGGTVLGVAIGLVNGLVINYFAIPPIIATLGTMFAVRAAVVAATEGNPIGGLGDDFLFWGQGDVAGIPMVLLIGFVILALAHVLLGYTNYGWSVRALGGSIRAARSAGIGVRRLSISVYVLGGMAAGFTGALLAARIGSGSPTFGQGSELQVIAAAVIGGTSIYGAIGSVPGAVLGALLLSVLTNGLVLLRVDPIWQNFVIGVVLVAAAGLDVLRRKQMFTMAARRAAGARRVA